MQPRLTFRLVVLTSLIVACCSLLFLPLIGAHADNEPWGSAQTVQAADLFKELDGSKSAPIVLFVGFRRLYTAGHIKGAQFHGTAGNADGLKELAAWTGSLPRTTNLVIYCGCCPMERCPNIRPAYQQLVDMGFRKLRVLVLPTSFAVDWADKGFPYEKGE